jgi:hypothetical protein
VVCLLYLGVEAQCLPYLSWSQAGRRVSSTHPPTGLETFHILSSGGLQAAGSALALASFYTNQWHGCSGHATEISVLGSTSTWATCHETHSVLHINLSHVSWDPQCAPHHWATCHETHSVLHFNLSHVSWDPQCAPHQPVPRVMRPTVCSTSTWATCHGTHSVFHFNLSHVSWDPQCAPLQPEPRVMRPTMCSTSTCATCYTLQPEPRAQNKSGQCAPIGLSKR